METTSPPRRQCLPRNALDAGWEKGVILMSRWSNNAANDGEFEGHCQDCPLSFQLNFLLARTRFLPQSLPIGKQSDAVGWMH
jgi:hypothetical protein